jgi:hypothetical protein
METIGQLFKDYAIFLYYDVSSDNTLDILQAYHNLHPERMSFYINEEPLLPLRTHRIAKGRNICLETIRKKYSDFPYFIVMDCDNVCSGTVNVDVLRNSLQRTDWECLSFFRDPYYDIWALSIAPFYLSCWHFHPGKKRVLTMQKFIQKKIKKMPLDTLLPCKSAFNGFAIYRTKYFLDCYYDGSFQLELWDKQTVKNCLQEAFKDGFSFHKERKEDCEHRSFHLMSIEKHNSRIRISPSILFS